MADVRGKFKVTRLTKHNWSKDVVEVRLDAEYSFSPEDQSYAAATPTAHIEMFVSNPTAAEKFVLGKSVYVDFTFIEDSK